MDNLLQILQLGVEKERLRKAAYEEAAQKTRHPLAQATFAALARQEAVHERYLQKIYEKQMAEQGWPAEGLEAAEDMQEVVREIFKQATAQIQAAAAQEEGLTEIYQAGIAAEQESIEFYADAAAKATTPQAKAFFEMLQRAERLHLKLLSETLEFLDEPSKWFFDEEGWIVEG